MNFCLRKSLCTALMFAIAFVSTVRADENGQLNSTDSEASNPAIEQAALAARLSILGEKKKSPILLVAAAELVGELNESSKDSSGVEKGDDSGENAGNLSSDLGYRALLDRAEAMATAQGDAGKATLTHIQLLRSRGIIFAQGTGKSEYKKAGITFKVMDQDTIGSGKEWNYKKIVFEGGKKAIVHVVGDGDGDLDLFVYDANTGGLIGKDTDRDSTPVVQWTPRYEGPFHIVVKNVGGAAENYYLLCNW